MFTPNPTPIPDGIIPVDIPISNYRVGRNGTVAPDTLVIHIAEGDKASCIATFKDPSVQKSSHFLIGKDGSITQFVSTKNTAFCNGIVDRPVSESVLKRFPQNPNDYTFSIENEGFATEDFTEAQYQTNAKLLAYLHKAWNVPMDSTHVIRHREIEQQKTCPGIVNVERIIALARAL